MPIVSEQYIRVVGVDTHAASHTLAVIDPVTAAQIDQATFPNTPAGLARAVAWAQHRVGENVAVLFVVEGIGSYGAGLVRRLAGQGCEVVEPAAMSKATYRGRGKSDPLDAGRIARSVLGIDITLMRRPRADGARAALRVLVVAREEMTAEHTRLINSLTALLRTVDLGVDARRSLSKTQIGMTARWRARTDEPIDVATARREAVRLATRIGQLDGDLRDNRSGIDGFVAAQAPTLLDMTGVGAVVAATVLLAWSHPGRVRSEAALASLAGTCPIPASSGNTERHRLNRGGDRRLNRAITTIALVRMRCDEPTKATSRSAPHRAARRRRSCGHSSGTSPDSSSAHCNQSCRRQPLTRYRSIPV